MIIRVENEEQFELLKSYFEKNNLPFLKHGTLHLDGYEPNYIVKLYEDKAKYYCGRVEDFNDNGLTQDVSVEEFFSIKGEPTMGLKTTLTTIRSEVDFNKLSSFFINKNIFFDRNDVNATYNACYKAVKIYEDNIYRVYNYYGLPDQYAYNGEKILSVDDFIEYIKSNLGEKKMNVNDKFAVKVNSTIVFDAVKEKATNLGFKCNDGIGECLPENTIVLYFNLYSDNVVCWDIIENNSMKDNTISLDEFFDIEEEKCVSFGKHLIRKISDGVRVYEGSGHVVTLSKTNVDDIYQLYKENTLPKEFSVKAIHPSISEVIQKRLFELGYKWSDGYKEVQYTDSVGINSYLVINYTSPENSFIRDCQPLNEEITLEELFNVKDPISVGGFEVSKTSGGIKFGCTEIPGDIVEEVYNLFN